MKKFSKVLMIFCVLFSQLNGSIMVLAEELLDDMGSSYEESAAITVTMDDDYQLTVKSNGNFDDSSSYDIYLTSSYKYDYDDSEKSGYNDEKINEDVILGSVFNDTGYTVSVDSIETNYNGVYFISVSVVNTETSELYSESVTKEISLDDTFNVLANGEVVDSAYTVADNKNVSFTTEVSLPSTTEETSSEVVVDGSSITDSFDINYDGMLYGTYIYEWNLLVEGNVYSSKSISVSYNSSDDEQENATILTNVNTAGVQFVSSSAYVSAGMSVSELLSSISMSEYDVKVLDSSSDEVTSGNVSNGMSLTISKDGLVLTYTLVVVGDVNSDSVVDENDIIDIIDSILVTGDRSTSADVNIDGKVDIFDITKIVDALQNGWDHTVSVDKESILNPEISSDVTDEVSIGDTVTVRFYLNNFNQNVIQGLSGKINYDNTILSLNEVSVNGMEMYYNPDGEFIAYGNDYDSEDVFIEVVFTAIGASEMEYVSLSELVAAYAGEEVVMSSSSVGISFEVTYTSNVGSDVETTESTTTSTTTSACVAVEKVVSTYSETKSSDSYLADLIIEGVDFEFSPYTFNYEITVGNDISSLDLTVVLSDSNATYEVYGNEIFEVGENIVTVVVTAEDGSTHTYTIVVNKEDSEATSSTKKNSSSESIKESSVSRIIIIILIILVIIGLIYLIFKDDEDDDDSTNNKREKERKKNK